MEQEQHSKNISPYIAWSLVALFAGISAFTNWYYYDQVSTAYDSIPTFYGTDVHKKVATTTATTTTPAATSATADWKTYTNSTIGFSFKYPESYSIKKDSLPGKLASNNLSVEGENGNPVLNLWVDADGFGPFFPNIVYVLEQNNQGVKIAKRTVEEKNENQSKDSTLIIAQNVTLGSHSYLFHFSFKSDKDYEQTFKNILSTFQFTK